MEVFGIDHLIRSLERERKARKEAEQLLEHKSLELYRANQVLEKQQSILKLQLSASDFNFATIVESLPDLVVEIDNEGKIIFINNFGERILLKEKGFILGNHFVDFILESPTVDQFRAFLNKKKVYVEFQVVSSLGEIRPFGFRIVEKLKSSFGEISTTYLAVGRDLSVFKRLNRQIGWTKQFYSKALSSLKLMIVVVDDNFQFVRGNEAFQELFDTDSIFSSNGLRENLKETQENNLLSSIKEIVLNNLEYKEVRLVATNGNIIWVNIVFFSEVTLVNSSEHGFALVLRDITETKLQELELLIARNNAIGALQAEREIVEMVSHEMRTPLNVILGLPPLIAKEENAQLRQSMTTNLLYAAKLLNQFVSTTLDLHMISSKHYNATLEWLNYNDLIYNICAVPKSSISKNVSFTSFSTLDDSIEVKLDGRLFASIVLNLLNNANKYTTKGSIEITSTTLSKQQDSFLVLEVKDTGIGISQEELPFIFKKHYRSNAGNVGIKGLGLGLTIVYEAVQLLNGSIKVESQVGVGTTFHIELPIEYRLSQGSVHTQKDDLEGNADLEFQPNHFKVNLVQRVLLIEDDSLNADYFTRLLAEWRISVDWAINKEEALYFLSDAKSSYMAVFVDLNLENGVTAFDIIGLLKEKTDNILFFLMTASRVTYDLLGPEASHFKEIVYKPYSAEDLLKIFNKYYILKEVDFRLKSFNKFEVIGLPEFFDVSYLYSFYKENTDHFVTNLLQVVSHLDSWLEELSLLPRSESKAQLIISLHRIIPNLRMIGLTDLALNCENYQLALQRIEPQGLGVNVELQALISTARSHLLTNIDVVKELLKEFVLKNNSKAK
jgi:PAS domain S-box-containing protein